MGFLLPSSANAPLRVTDFRPDDTAENPFNYTFKVQCTSCREVHPNWVTLNRFVRLCAQFSPHYILTELSQENHEQSGSRGEANFVWKCKNCKVRSSTHDRRLSAAAG